MKLLYLTPILVTLVGSFFLVKLRAFFVIRPIKSASLLFSTKNGKNAFASLSLALAGTLGIGNVIGVAIGISIGGAGAVFWLLISSVFSAAIKYAEASASCELGEGKGMIGVIEKMLGRRFAIIYAILAVILCFSMGTVLQSSSISHTLAYSIGMRKEIVSAIITVLLIVIIYFFGENVERVTAYLIPLTTIVYIFFCFATIIQNIDELPRVLNDIARSAFKVESGVGGIVGFLFSTEIREGYMRGILSNEAGAGTSSLAHLKNNSSPPASVGLMGVAEVLFDTVVLCTLTAFATLCSLDSVTDMSGVEIIMEGIGSSFGMLSEIGVSVCIFLFAFSTVVCWYYYGAFSFRYAFKGASLIYTPLFILAVFMGCFVLPDSTVTLCDLVLLLLSLISLSALFKSSDRIITLSEQSGLVNSRR